jgi:hypothetical protein
LLRRTFHRQSRISGILNYFQCRNGITDGQQSGRQGYPIVALYYGMMAVLQRADRRKAFQINNALNRKMTVPLYFYIN